VSHYAPRHGVPLIARAPLGLDRYDIVVANEYYLVWALGLRLAFKRKPRLVALGFNQSARLIRTGFAPFDALLNRIWRRVSGFVVHSQEEARLFHRLHGIPADRFSFSHWGYDLPAFTHGVADRPSGPYVTMIGRNNRDVATFCAAVEQAGVEGVLVTSAYVLEGSDVRVPAAVRLLTDRPMAECLDLVAGSFAHLILVVDGERGAGHISAVSAMLLEKPQIFSDVAPIADYLADGFNGIAVPLADVTATVAAIRRLADDPALGRKLGANGRAFATAWMSHEGSSQRLVDAVVAVAQGLSLPRVDGWRAAIGR
jgi:hypothetical protein